MKKIILSVILISFFSLFLKAQENEEEWTMKTHVTGYLALNGEYIHNLPVFKTINGTDKSLNIGEASVLTNIMPLENFKINSVFTYKPNLQFNDIIVELSGEWSFSEKLIVKAGRFLLPLHPGNSNYYAPMNVGIALPIFVTNHILFPLNINGVSFSGKFSLNDNFAFKYFLSGGEYLKKSRDKAGLLGFFGRDGVYMNTNTTQIINSIAKLDQQLMGKNFFGVGGKVTFEIINVLEFGPSFFISDEIASIQPTPTTYFETAVRLFNYGLNLDVNYNNLKIKSAFWFGNETPEDLVNFEAYNTTDITGELAYSFGKITPYTKIELINGRSKKFNRFTTGINIRPVFETTIKLEFNRYIQNYVDDFNVFQISVIYSF